MMSAQTETSSAVTQAGVFLEKSLPPEDEYESREELFVERHSGTKMKGVR